MAVVHSSLFLAAVAKTYAPIFQTIYPTLKHLGVIGLTVAVSHRHGPVEEGFADGWHSPVTPGGFCFG